MELAHVEAFLVLAEELHFGRTAQRLYVSQSRVSRLVAALEREAGGALFERTSRNVRLTPAGQRLRDRLAPAYAELRAALTATRAELVHLDGELRVGFTATTGGPQLNKLITAFEQRHQDCRLTLHEVDLTHPFDALRAGDLDVVMNWLFTGSADLVCGAAIDYQRRMLAVAADHPLSGRESVRVADFARYALPYFDRFPAELRELFLLDQQAVGSTLRYHPNPLSGVGEVIAGVARGRIVHVTMTAMTVFAHRDDITLIPIDDLPSAGLGPIWRATSADPYLAAFASIAAELAANPGGSDEDRSTGHRP